MALTMYSRVKLFWGALDAESGYSGTQNVDLGAAAGPGTGTAVRRAQLIFARAAPSGWSEDVAVCHFDFINYTGGNPDETWTGGDYTTLETALTTWWTAVKSTMNGNCNFREIRWYRKGPGLEGIPGPAKQNNPAVRVKAIGIGASGVASLLPPQVSISITFKTGRRLSWGRTYIPDIDASTLATDGRVTQAACDLLANSTNTLFQTAAAADFQPVVYSPKRSAAYGIEAVQVDNIFDVIRRRRWDSTTYRKQLNT